MNEKERAVMERLSAYLKKRFPNLSVEEVIRMVLDVMEITQ